MTTALMIGSAVGAVIGLFHAYHVYSRRLSESPGRLIEHSVRTRASAGYYALWTFVLWVIFGSYVFFLWLISVVVYAVDRAIMSLARSR